MCFSHDSGVFAERFALRSSGVLGGSGRPVLMQHDVYREVGCSQGSAPRPGKLPGVLPGPASALCPQGHCPPRSWGTEPTSQVLPQLSAPGVTRQLAPCPPVLWGHLGAPRRDHTARAWGARRRRRSGRASAAERPQTAPAVCASTATAAARTPGPWGLGAFVGHYSGVIRVAARRPLPRRPTELRLPWPFCAPPGPPARPCSRALTCAMCLRPLCVPACPYLGDRPVALAGPWHVSVSDEVPDGVQRALRVSGVNVLEPGTPMCAQRLRPTDGVQVLPSRAGPGCLVAERWWLGRGRVAAAGAGGSGGPCHILRLVSVCRPGGRRVRPALWRVPGHPAGRHRAPLHQHQGHLLQGHPVRCQVSRGRTGSWVLRSELSEPGVRPCLHAWPNPRWGRG